MNKELLFTLISTIFIIVGAYPLWKDILRWRTTPHPFTTGVWLLLVGFNCFVLFQSKEFYGLIPSIFAFATLLGETIFGYLRMKIIKINWFDRSCLYLSLGAIIYFLFTRDTFTTVIATVIIDGIACLPTMKKSWLQPWTETAWNYLIGGGAQLFTLLALASPNIETSFYWGFVLFADFLIVIILLSRRYYLKGWHSIFE